jgi:hypothetical protein
VSDVEVNAENSASESDDILDTEPVQPAPAPAREPAQPEPEPVQPARPEPQPVIPLEFLAPFAEDSHEYDELAGKLDDARLMDGYYYPSSLNSRIEAQNRRGLRIRRLIGEYIFYADALEEDKQEMEEIKADKERGRLLFLEAIRKQEQAQMLRESKKWRRRRRAFGREPSLKRLRRTN